MKESVFGGRWRELLFFIIAAPVLSWGLVCGVLGFTVLEFDYLSVFVGVLGVCAVVKIIFFNKYTFFVSLAVFAFFAAFVLYDIFSKKGNRANYIALYEFVTECVEFMLEYRPYRAEYADFIVKAFTAAAAVIVSLTAFSRYTFGMFAVSACAVFGACLYTADLKGSVVPFLAFVACMAVLLAKIMFETNMGYAADGAHRAERPKTASFALMLLPVAGLCVVAAYFLPKPRQGAFNKVITDIANSRTINSVSDFARDVVSGDFAINASGLGGADGRLGGDANPTDTPLFEVYGGDGGALVGSYKEIYTGRAWTAAETTFAAAEPAYFDTPLMETAFAAHQLDDVLAGLWGWVGGANGGASIGERVVTVKMIAGGTREIFHPQRFFSAENERGSDVLVNGAGDAVFKSVLRKGDMYTMRYFVPPANVSRAAAVVSREHLYKEFYDDIFNVGAAVNWLPVEFFGDRRVSYRRMFGEILIPHAERIYEKYTRLPDGLPERVRDLAVLAADGDGGYTAAINIEKFLQSEFLYTLTPGETPKDADFVDYFLFESKRGYCTSFASAFVIMCRALGMPARYAEGYIMPDGRGGNGAFLVTDRQGHAWGEVYFEGVGWLAFDPTPVAVPTGGRFAGADRITGERRQEYSVMEPEPDPTESPFGQAADNPVDYAADEPQPTSPPTDLELLVAALSVRLKLVVAVAGVCGAFAVFGLIVFTVRRVRDVRALRRSNNKTAVYCYKRVLRFVRFFRFHYERAANETSAQFAERVGKIVGFENDTLFLRDLTRIFNRAAYGKNEISDAERDVMVRAYGDINARYEEKIGRLPFLCQKYILLKV